MVQPTEPLLTPAVRRRLREKFPGLHDSDLPVVSISENQLVGRIARRTAMDRAAVRQILHDIGVFVPRRVAVRSLRQSDEDNESTGSGIPDDTAQSGAMGMGPAW